MINIDLPEQFTVLTRSDLLENKIPIKNIPLAGGVYFIFCEDDLYYVGRSINLRERLHTHLTGRDKRTSNIHLNITEIKVIIEEGVAEQEIYETWAIKTLGPLLNRDKTDKHYQSSTRRLVFESDLQKTKTSLNSKLLDSYLELPLMSETFDRYRTRGDKWHSRQRLWELSVELISLNSRVREEPWIVEREGFEMLAEDVKRLYESIMVVSEKCVA